MIGIKPWIVLLLVIFVMPSGLMAEGEAGLSIRGRSFSQVRDKEICLKDIAEIHGPESVVQRLKNLKITYSPHPGKKRRIPGSMIEAKIRSEKTSSREQWDVVIPQTVMVERAYQDVPEAELKKLFYGFIEKKAQGKSFRIRDISIKGDRKLALGKMRLDVDDRNIRDIEGRVSLTVLARVPSEQSRKIYLSGWVDVFDQVVCASRDIARGELIVENDLSLDRKNLSKIPGDVLRETDAAAGTLARSHIEKGRCLRSSMIEQAPLVRKGDVVKIIAQSGLLTVVTTGVSKEDGVLGEQIQVENSTSNKMVAGRVVDAKTVEVVF